MMDAVMLNRWRRGVAAVLGGAAVLGAAGGAGAMPESALRFEATARGVRALQGEEVRWEFSIVSHTINHGGPPLPAPVRVGDSLVFCGEGQLYEASPVDGVIRRRVRLPGRCAGVTAAEEGYEVRCQGNSSSAAPWTKTYSLRIGQELPGPVLPDPYLLFTPRRQAEDLVGKDLPRSLAALDQRRAVDPTNPWYDVKRAEVLARLNRPEDARQAVADALGHDHRYDLDLLMATPRLDLLDPGRADEAFRRGMTHLLQRGYEPELATSMLVPTMLLGRPNDSSGSATEAPPLDFAKDHAALERHGARLIDLAPNAEGSTWFFAALAQAAEQRGDQAAAARWRPLGQRAEGTSLFAPGPPETRHLGALVQAVLSLSVALIVLALVKTIQGLRWRHEDAAPWWVRRNPFARWARAELVGFLLGVGVLVGMARWAASGVSIVGAMAGAPTALIAGNLTHPEAVAFLRKADTPASRFLLELQEQMQEQTEDFLRSQLPEEEQRRLRPCGHGLAHQAAHKNEPASQEPPHEPRAATLSNQAARAATHGDPEGARALWQQAIAIEPQQDAARAGLGLPDPGPRAERLRRHGVSRPLLALPRPLLWAGFWRERVAAAGPGTNPIRWVRAVAALSTDGGADEVHSSVLVSLLLTIPAALALLTWRRPVEARPAWSRVNAMLAVLVPGTARFYGPVGFLIGGVAVFAVFGFYVSVESQGQAATVLDGIIAPAWGRFYGVQELAPAISPLVTAVRLWWVLFAINALAVLAAERPARRPDTGNS